MDEFLTFLICSKWLSGMVVTCVWPVRGVTCCHLSNAPHWWLTLRFYWGKTMVRFILPFFFQFHSYLHYWKQKYLCMIKLKQKVDVAYMKTTFSYMLQVYDRKVVHIFFSYVAAAPAMPCFLAALVRQPNAACSSQSAPSFTIAPKPARPALPKMKSTPTLPVPAPAPSSPESKPQPQRTARLVFLFQTSIWWYKLQNDIFISM